MTIRLLPDVEQLLSTFLAAQPELTVPVCTALPANPTFPVIRVTRYGGPPAVGSPLHLDAAALQVDVFGGAKKTAYQIAATARALIDARIVGGHDEGVVTGAAFGPLAWQPDDTYEPAKPRYLFTLTIWTRPTTPTVELGDTLYPGDDVYPGGDVYPG